jgi:hypothetical protein
MFAQVVQGGTTPELRPEMDRIVNEMLMPALKDEPGFAGGLNLVDRETGNGMMIMLWETEEHANLAPSERGPNFLKARAEIASISTGNRSPITMWEVNAQV